MSTVSTGHWFYAAMIIVGSGIGLYYYLRVMITLFQTPTKSVTVDAPHHWGQTAGGIMVLMTAAAVLVFGIYPDPLIAVMKQASLFIPLQLLFSFVH